MARTANFGGSGIDIVIHDHELGKSGGFTLRAAPLKEGVSVGLGSVHKEKKVPFRVPNGELIELVGRTIAEMQGVIQIRGRQLQYENLAWDGAMLLRGERTERIRQAHPVDLAEGDILFLGHYEDGPEYSIEIRRIY